MSGSDSDSGSRPGVSGSDSDSGSSPGVSGGTEVGWVRVRRGFLPFTIGVLVLAGALVPLPGFVEAPGAATGVPACVVIQERPSASVDGDFLFTTVSQREATVFDLMAAAVSDNRRVVARQDLLGGRQRGDYLAQQRQVFLDSTDRAVIVALEAAGQTVEREGSGAAIVAVLDDTPAAGVLRAGDVITRIAGQPIRTDDDLVAAIDDTAPLELQVRRDGARRTETVVPEMREIDGQSGPVMGVRIATADPSVELPLAIDVTSGRVGGPSAGLMIGLAVYDLVSDVELADGRRIAGTGTLGLDGRVGGIDNIDLKVAAALAVDADVFVAPGGQADAARAAVPDGGGLEVVGADTFAQVVERLRRDEVADTGSGGGAPVADTPCPFVDTR